jgi:adenosylcobinamide amidohydrolase
MHKENNVMSAIIQKMREYLTIPYLTSVEKLLGKIYIRTIMSESTPDMFSDDELSVLSEFKDKIGLNEDDMVRMAISITCEKISNKDPHLSKADALIRLTDMCEDLLKDDDDTDDGCSPVFVVA